MSGDREVNVAGVKMRAEMLAAWVFRLLLLVAMLWASNNFVSKTTYESDKRENDAALMVIKETLVRIDEKMKNDVRQDKVLDDHELRIRVLEGKH